MAVSKKDIAAIAAAAARERLEFILIGGAAGYLHGAPLNTEDYDLFVRDTPLNRRKIAAVARHLGGAVWPPFELSRTLRIVTETVSVDFIFALSSRAKFESLRSRATRIHVGNHTVMIASLEDIIAAKEAAARSKDQATVYVLKETLRVKQAMAKEEK